MSVRLVWQSKRRRLSCAALAGVPKDTRCRGAVRRLFQLTAVSYCLGRYTTSWAAVVIVLCALWCMFVDRPSVESQGICSRWMGQGV